MSPSKKDALFAMIQQSASNLTKEGVNAYRNGEFEKSVTVLQQQLDRDKMNWEAKLYLAMSHYKLGQIYLAEGHFRTIVENCPNTEFQQKATLALQAMKPELSKPKKFKSPEIDSVEWKK